nr:NAD(P)-binding protein [Luteolibacter marinus]
MGEKSPTVFLLGFSWTASSLLEELSRRKPALLPRLKVIDFNPETHHKLRERGVPVVYGDISQRDVLEHAGIGDAEVIICSLPDSILRGASNQRMLRQLRALNQDAEIIVHAERITDVHELYAAGASFVVIPRLLESGDLMGLLDAVENQLVAEFRSKQQARLAGRDEIVP